MKRLIIFIGVLMTQGTTTVFACDCNYAGSFIKMSQQSELVALVKITNYLSFKDIYGNKTPMSMDVEIIDLFKGKEKRKSVTVWGDPGYLCRPYLSTFIEGQYYIIAFNTGYPNQGNPNEKISDYCIFNCGEYWLTVNNEKTIATGDIDSKDRSKTSMPIKQLKSELTNNKSDLTKNGR